jgi:peptide/nickel transport system permease protein
MSESPAAVPVDALGTPPSAGVGRRLWSLVRHQPAATAGVVVLAIFVLIAVLAPVIAPYDPHEKVGEPFAPPSPSHPFGLDDGGVDMLSLMMDGARVSLIVGFAAAAVAMLIGGFVGLTSGYFGGKLDTGLTAVTNYMIAIPDVPLILIVAALFGRSLTNIIIIIGAIYWTYTARIIRAETKSLRERVFVKRARSLGAGNTRILGRHILPQVAPLLIAQTVLFVAYAIFAETYVTFLGLGDPSLISWGKLIANAFEANAITAGAWWAIVPPGFAVAFVVLACTMIGRALEDALNPRLRVGHLSVHRFRVRQLREEEP